ncbi:MAG: SYNERG-CTERM sorting domain-containing protein [Synergistaceae bacterium]|jgi:Synergist-CTERM protein sorting domain-containing protein|nr:SYNERG-CTERM sorting domain-containing protein [Synergistaceae bacterium]
MLKRKKLWKCLFVLLSGVLLLSFVQPALADIYFDPQSIMIPYISDDLSWRWGTNLMVDGYTNLSDYKLALFEGSNEPDPADTPTSVEYTGGGVTMSLTMLPDGSVDGSGKISYSTNAMFTVRATNRTISADILRASFTVSAVGVEGTGNALGAEFSIYDKDGNPHRPSYMFPGTPSRFETPIYGHLDGTYDRMVVTIVNPLGSITQIMHNPYNEPGTGGVAGSDGFFIYGSLFEMWYTPKMRGPHVLNVYYPQGGYYYHQSFKFEGEVPGESSGQGCDGGLSALVLLAALPVLAIRRGKKRE